MRGRVESAIAGVAVAILIVATSAVSLATPGLTSFLVVRTAAPELSGLSERRTVEVAELVRGYVVGSFDGPLPGTVDARPGFDVDDVLHLDDVRGVFALARIAAATCAAAVAAWVAACLAYRRTRRLVSGLRVGALVSAGAVGLATSAALIDFDAFFAGFHGIFFEAGTWMFPQGDLLIALFPERFWAIEAAAWGVLVLAGAGLCWWAAWLVERESRRRQA